MKLRDMVKDDVLRDQVAAISCGLYGGKAVLDLDYAEDSNAETDMNVVMTEAGNFIEVQGTGEEGDFNLQQLQDMIGLARQGIAELISKQKEVLR